MSISSSVLSSEKPLSVEDDSNSDLSRFFNLSKVKPIVYGHQKSSKPSHGSILNIDRRYLGGMDEGEVAVCLVNNNRKLEEAHKRLRLLRRTGASIGDNSLATSSTEIDENENAPKRIKKSEVVEEDRYENDSEPEMDGVKKKTIRYTPKDREESNRRAIFVGNVPVDTNKRSLEKLFAPYGTIESIRYRNAAVMKPKARGPCVIKGKFHPERETLNAYIQFKDQSSVEGALHANLVEFKGRHLRVDRAQSPKLSASDFWNCVYISGLPFAAEEEDMYELFRPCGEVIKVRIIRDQYYKVCRGYGYVQFSTESAMQKALKQNGKHKYKGKQIHITIATPEPKGKPGASHPKDRHSHRRPTTIEIDPPSPPPPKKNYSKLKTLERLQRKFNKVKRKK